MKHWKPVYRNLGAPPPLPNYIRYDDDHWDRDDFKGQGHKHKLVRSESRGEAPPIGTVLVVFLYE